MTLKDRSWDSHRLPGGQAPRLDLDAQNLADAAGRMQLSAVGGDFSVHKNAVYRFSGRMEASTERKKAAQEIQEAKERFETIFNTGPDAILISRLSDGCITDVNNAFCELSGYTKEEAIGNTTLGLNFWVNADDRLKFIDELQATGCCKNFEVPLREKEGEQGVGVLSAGIIHIHGVPHIICTTSDITERKRSEHMNEVMMRRHQALMRSSHEGIHIMNAQGDLVEFNDTFCRMLGYTREEAASLHVADWDAQWSREQLMERFINLLQVEGSVFESRHRRKNGEVIDVEISTTGTVIDGQYYLYASSRDITERKRVGALITNMAFHDALTGLPNRNLLNDRLEQALAAGKRSGRYGALLFIDLDNFKPLNDSYGHDAGDLLLKETAHRIRSCVREIDTVARFGGDEFLVMLSELEEDKSESTTQARTVAEKIRTILEQPYVLKIRHEEKREAKAELIIEHRCTASIGVALFFNYEGSAADIVKWADLAMYQAKENGRNYIHFFDPLS